MGVALEEPREGDEMVDLGGVALALPRDVRMVLRAYRSAVVDHDPRWGGNLGFFVRYDRGSWRC